jgi:hypothetical protein
MSTEIYICKPGQALKEGRVEYSDIDNRAEAEADAKRRCDGDPTIAKIAYYAVTPDGDFRCIYTHQGSATEAPAQKPNPAAKRKKVKKKKPQKKGFLQRLFGR